MMNTNLLVSPNILQRYYDELDRFLEEHITRIGDFNCLMLESLPDDVMYVCDGEKIVKVVNIGTKEN